MLTIVLFLVLFISVTALGTRDCPPWFKWVNTSSSSGYCICASEVIGQIQCDQLNQKSYLRVAGCVFYDSDKDEVVAARCPFLPANSSSIKFLLPSNVNDLNEYVCGIFHREAKDPICGKYTGNTGPSIYSVGSQCVPCRPINVVYYLLLQYAPITLLFLVVLLLKLNITAAPMSIYVLFCNVIVFYCKCVLPFYTELYGSSNSYIVGLVKLVASLSAVWSFDALFFIAPPLCMSKHLEEIYMPLIEFVAILYPFILLLLTYIVIQLHFYNFKPIVTLWGVLHRFIKRFHRNWEPTASLIQTFSSLFFLSYAKFNFIICQSLLQATLMTEDGRVTSRLAYIDPTLSFLSKKHVYMLTFSAFVLTFLYSPPILLLTIYPTSLYRKISERIRPRWRIGIKTFVETYQGCYKDSTNGTRDYRAISGCIFATGFFLVLVELIAEYAIPDANNVENNTAQYCVIIYLVFIIIIVLLTQPFKEEIANITTVAICVIGSAIFALSTGLHCHHQTDLVRIMIITLIFLPHCGFGVHLIWKVNIFETCYNKYRNLWSEEKEGQ